MIKDSDPRKWEYKEHTEVKHILFEKYLRPWLSILGKWNPKICYVDGFAGRGEYNDGTLGSPLIVLKVADSLSKYFKEMICFFIEKDPENFRNLQRVLEREKTKIENRHKIEIRKENAEFADVVYDIFEYLEKEKIPCFFFIDPFGFSEIPFAVIRKILEYPKTEVFFTFMERDLGRFISWSGLEGTVNELFGTDEWRYMLKSSEKQELDLIYLYRRQLHDVAAVNYSWPFKMCSSEKDQTIYYLLHVTNNLLGHSIMKDIMFNQSVEGNFAYLGPQEITARTQIRLFNIDSTQDLKEYLVHRFKGEGMNFEEIQERVCTPWYEEPPYASKHYKEALKELERERKIKVNRITSKTERGLSGKDMITFPQ